MNKLVQSRKGSASSRAKNVFSKQCIVTEQQDGDKDMK